MLVDPVENGLGLPMKNLIDATVTALVLKRLFIENPLRIGTQHALLLEDLFDPVQPAFLGDGPLLGTAKLVHRSPVPVLMGDEGFLQQALPDETDDIGGDLLVGHFIPGGAQSGLPITRLGQLPLQLLQAFPSQVRWALADQAQGGKFIFILFQETTEGFQVIFRTLGIPVPPPVAEQLIGMVGDILASGLRPPLIEESEQRGFLFQLFRHFFRGVFRIESTISSTVRPQ